jgi:hypothetical protein
MNEIKKAMKDMKNELNKYIEILEKIDLKWTAQYPK